MAGVSATDDESTAASQHMRDRVDQPHAACRAATRAVAPTRQPSASRPVFASTLRPSRSQAGSVNGFHRGREPIRALRMPIPRATGQSPSVRQRSICLCHSACQRHRPSPSRAASSADAQYHRHHALAAADYALGFHHEFLRVPCPRITHLSSFHYTQVGVSDLCVME